MRVSGVALVCLISVSGCAPANEPMVETPIKAPAAATSTAPATSPTILGRWFVDSVDDLEFPKPETGLRAFVDFDESGFLSHAASCGGGYPAFFTLEGQSIAVTRREAVIYAKCDSPAGERRERALTVALDAAASWQLAGDRLTITASGGSVIRLSRPTEPIPELGGEWVVVSIGGKPFDDGPTARVTISRGFMGGTAGCNHLSTEYEATRGGAFRLTGSLITTQVRCEPAAMQRDGTLSAALGSATGWSVRPGGGLTLTGPQDIVLRRPEGRETQLWIP